MSKTTILLNINLQFIGQQIAAHTFLDGEGAANLADYLTGAPYAIGFSAYQNGRVQTQQTAALAQTISEAGIKRWKELTLGQILMETEAGGHA